MTLALLSGFLSFVGRVRDYLAVRLAQSLIYFQYWHNRDVLLQTLVLIGAKSLNPAKDSNVEASACSGFSYRHCFFLQPLLPKLRARRRSV